MELGFRVTFAASISVHGNPRRLALPLSSVLKRLGTQSLGLNGLGLHPDPNQLGDLCFFICK